jgi:hypothetical protein
MKINSARFGAVSLGAVLLVATAPAAMADTAFLSYTLQDSSVVTATFAGTLAGDLFTVTSTVALAFNGFSYNPADFPVVDSVDEFIGLGSDVPILSLSGTYLDFFVASTPTGGDGFLLAVGNDVSIPFFGGPAFSSSSAFGGTTEPFVLDNYSLTVDTSSVPEASTWAAGGAVLLAAGGTWFRSRRQA